MFDIEIENKEREKAHDLFLKQMYKTTIARPIFQEADRVKDGKSNGIQYYALIKIYFAIRLHFPKKEVSSVEKTEKAIMVRFNGALPTCLTFKKVEELVEQYQSIPLENLEDISIGLRFTFLDLVKMIEPATLSNIKCLVEGALNPLQEECDYYLKKAWELKDYYCIRRLCTYETDREKEAIDYANLSKKDELLPLWFLWYKAGTFEKLTRKEQLVAYLNDYNDIYQREMEKDVRVFQYVERWRPSNEQIEIHRKFTYRGRMQ